MHILYLVLDSEFGATRRTGMTVSFITPVLSDAGTSLLNEGEWRGHSASRLAFRQAVAFGMALGLVAWFYLPFGTYLGAYKGFRKAAKYAKSADRWTAAESLSGADETGTAGFLRRG